MSLITDQLFNILKNVKRPGSFYVNGKLEAFPPTLEVDGVGRIALPLLSLQAEQLVNVAEQAPYGRGQETIVDTQVRKTWQIDANRVTLSGKYWQKSLASIIDRVVTGLGVTGTVKAELYKLLAYDEGCFFISHRDTEKAEGMFATLVIVLPSVYSGGELVIKHHEQQVNLDLSCDDSSEMAFAAFYADCVHEVLPITQGCRLTLIYNLLRTDKKMPLPKAPDYHREQDELVALLNNWTAELSTDSHEAIPEKLIYLLEHAYTPAELGFDALKNTDIAIAEVLVAATKVANCDIHLALVSVEESGTAEYTGRSRRRRRWDEDEDEDDFEIDEVFDRFETVSNWRRPDGNQSLLPTLPISAHEFCPPDAWEDIEPGDISFHEATGNEGASFERSYSHAALVIWPQAGYFAIINQAGMDSVLPVLHDFYQRWITENQNQDSSLWQDAHTLAAYILRDWVPEYLDQSPQHSRPMGEFLKYEYNLGDTINLKHVWSMIATKGFYQRENTAILVQTAELLPWADVVSWTEQAVSISAIKDQEACAILLAGLSLSGLGAAKDLSVAAETLFAALPGDPGRFPQLQPWAYSRTVDVNGVINVLTSMSLIDTTLAANTLNYILAWPAIYDMDRMLVSVALKMTETQSSSDLPVVKSLRNTVRTHLNAQVAKVLEPPADWQRDSKIKCTCKDCVQLRDFLASPTQSRWSFKAVEAKRKHLEQSIKTHNSDVNCMTERSSRPYSLVCTKNDASYQRGVTQIKNDLDALSRLSVD